MEFERIDKAVYAKDLEEMMAYQEMVSQRITEFKRSLEKQPPIVLRPLEKLTTKVDTVFDDSYDSDIVLQIPESIMLHESGDIKNEKLHL